MSVSLIGLPSSGKSSVGVILAKIMAFEFIDTDILIQTKYKATLQEIVDREGYKRLREIEEEIVLGIDCSDCVIATGGSVVYSKKAMEYLRDISTVVYLKIGFDEMIRRLGDYSKRGLAKPKNQTLNELYEERVALYEKYAHFTVINDKSATDAALKIYELVR
ncbi:shikimate kinase [Hippea alviniae]|uniref:shikimate kinase n=1 Tax=Hippea alviniae TaxID=1279027 RepID=UPI0003F82951|nr:shikimate kinase [Hippea alviniae]